MLILSRIILSSIIRDWILLKELCKLDSSACNSKLREKLVDAISSGCLTFVGLEKSSTSDAYYAWLAARSIRIDQVHISKMTEVQLIRENLSLFSSITALSTHSCCEKTVKDMLTILQNAPKIKDLKISHSRMFTTQRLKIIASVCRQLTSLTVYHCVDVGNIGLTRVVSDCVHLSKLHVINNVVLSDRTILELCRRRSKTITDLKFIKCTKLTNASLLSISTYLPKLRKLSVSGNSEMSSLGFLNCATNCTELSELQINLYRFVFQPNPDEDCISQCVSCFAIHGANMISLNLEANRSVNDACILDVAKNCILLQYLNVCECFDLTDTSITKIAENCQQLSTLLLRQCHRVTIGSLVKVAKLRILDLQQTTSLIVGFVNLFTVCERIGSSLLRLDISKVKEIEDCTIDLVTQHCQKLTHLSIYYCGETYPVKYQLTVECITYVARLVDLEWFNFAGNFRMGNENLLFLASNCTKLRTIIGILLENARQDPYRYYTDSIVYITAQCETKVREMLPGIVMSSYEIYSGGNYNLPCEEEWD